MPVNSETSVIINEITTIKLIQLKKKNNYKSVFNVFATAIYRHSRILLRTDDHFPVKSQLNQFQFIVSCISTVITRDRQFRLQSFLKHELILVLKASLTISLVEKKPISRDTSSSKWDVVDGKLNTLPLQSFLIIAMFINGETSVIINETTTIKLIELRIVHLPRLFA